MSAGALAKSDLVSLLGDVKARMKDRLGNIEFPIPHFVLIGKQSVGKSRLVEALAGEQFNFCPDAVGSRRPTVVEFRNRQPETPGQGLPPRWLMRDRTTNQWCEHSPEKLMQFIASAHEECGEHVSMEPVYCRVESSNCIDMQVVDLPGFRESAMDESRPGPAQDIERLVRHYMEDSKNVMICVEEAGDASAMSLLARCQQADPQFSRTVRVRTKLDKQYGQLSQVNVHDLMSGHGDLPDKLHSFSLTLPHWEGGQQCPKPFVDMLKEKDKEDVRMLKQFQLSDAFMKTVGFDNFAKYMVKTVETLFVEKLSPVMMKLKDLKQSAENGAKEMQTEFEETDPQRILSTCRECGVSFGNALNHVMEGVIGLGQGCMTLSQELTEFHRHHAVLGSDHFSLLPSEDFGGVNEYIEYLQRDIEVPAFDMEINGGAQFRRMIAEVEIFLRFSELRVEMTKKDVVQARGVSMGAVTWRDVVGKLLSNEAHLPLLKRVMYVGERIKWFFCRQKEAVLDFMSSLEGTPAETMYSPLYPKHARLIRQNEVIKNLVFDTYDKAVDRQLRQFADLFENMLTSTFSNPWACLKGATAGRTEQKPLEDALLPSFEDTKERIPLEIEFRSSFDDTLSEWLLTVPSDPHQTDEAVERVQMLVLRTYSFIRGNVCDQVELFSESFFKLPMLRRLEGDMSQIRLSEDQQKSHDGRRRRLQQDRERQEAALSEVNWCIERLSNFSLNLQSAAA